MSIRFMVIVAFALLSAACSAKAAGPPDIVVDTTACSHCGMLISEPIYAAAYQADGQEPRVFDDIGCLLDAMRRAPAPPAKIWVQDATGAGWLDAHDAIFVASDTIRTPMRGGALAYADTIAAGAAATRHRGEVMRSVEELMEWKGDPR